MTELSGSAALILFELNHARRNCSDRLFIHRMFVVIDVGCPRRATIPAISGMLHSVFSMAWQTHECMSVLGRGEGE